MDTASTSISRRELLTVDLRGLKAALFATSRSRGVSPSELVRSTLIDAINTARSPVVTRDSIPARGEARVRLSLRMSRAEVLASLAAAQAAGMTPGAYVAGLVADIAALTVGGSSQAHLAALIAFTAEMTTLNRHLRQLNRLLREQPSGAGEESRAIVDRLVHGVRGHLEAASALMADLRPRGRRSAPDPRSLA